MLITNIKDASNFSRISISRTENFIWKLPMNYLLSTKLYFLYITIKPQILLNIKYTNLCLESRRRDHLKMFAVYFLKMKVWNL